ncbi:MAG: hypothetical protein WC763_05150 [Candidatus Paceibacterota bacterium]
MTVSPTATNAWNILPETPADDFLMSSFFEAWQGKGADIFIKHADGRTLRVSAEMTHTVPDTLGPKIRRLFGK